MDQARVRHHGPHLFTFTSLQRTPGVSAGRLCVLGRAFWYGIARVTQEVYVDKNTWLDQHANHTHSDDYEQDRIYPFRNRLRGCGADRSSGR